MEAETRDAEERTGSSSNGGQELHELLKRAFGFPSFRPNQEAVCRAAMAGRDVLLVMPTGSGKSLCYQLPGLARGGTTLVVSPLIALMEDQVSKLAALRIPVARIHSGQDRAVSRQACIDYLNGRLRFLFIAPERLRVPGFAEMLARRKPSLIAIDEAHCISQWGHDFRPDYRMLGRHLPAMRPAPVMALTATATVVVQDDIVAQLDLNQAARFIQGFRRDNLAIEAVEVPRSRRAQITCELLKDVQRRPAIVYAPTRKEAEELASVLAKLFPTMGYHAGLAPAVREQVQRRFLEGRLEAVVATIAFGMGIDKPDVRTVIHTALPASVEAYYQEIGRAGRDGLPSRTILMHSYADRRTHDFFFERDYPRLEVLESIFRRLGPKPQETEPLREALRMDSEQFEKALEKLAIHAGVQVDAAGQVLRGGTEWRKSYAAQAEQRRSQIDQMVRYAEANTCRMSALVRHFGDLADSAQACGHCDFCAPEQCVSRRFRSATQSEWRMAHAVAGALSTGRAASVGKLFKELASADISRNDFRDLLGAMARVGLVQLQDAIFEKDGKSISYEQVWLTAKGHQMADSSSQDSFTQQRMGLPVNYGKRGEQEPRRRRPTPTVEATLSPASATLEKKLQTWRQAEAKKLGVPAFCIFGNQTLRALALERPTTPEAMLEIYGIGKVKVERFGEAVCRICGEETAGV